MLKYLVGTGGWGYFNTGNKPSLKAYSELFSFVEVNSTFYEYCSLELVENWRRVVPKEFVFSVRCHQDLTHRVGLKPTDEALDVFYRMKAYCQVLETPYLILETPVGYSLDSEQLNAAHDLFSTVALGELRLVWEYRAPITPQVSRLMQDYGIVQSVDLSLQNPPINFDITYARLFGKGKHNVYQFTDDELKEIQNRSERSGSKTTILSFHGARMYTDAARFQTHLATGNWMQTTNAVGADSAKSVLSEDATFPATKTQLIADQGWKVIDLAVDRRVHLGRVLDMIEDKTYFSTSEVVDELRRVI